MLVDEAYPLICWAVSSPNVDHSQPLEPASWFSTTIGLSAGIELPAGSCIAIGPPLPAITDTKVNASRPSSRPLIASRIVCGNSVGLISNLVPPQAARHPKIAAKRKAQHHPKVTRIRSTS